MNVIGAEYEYEALQKKKPENHKGYFTKPATEQNEANLLNLVVNDVA